MKRSTSTTAWLFAALFALAFTTSCVPVEGEDGALAPAARTPTHVEANVLAPFRRVAFRYESEAFVLLFVIGAGNTVAGVFRGRRRDAMRATRLA